MILVEWVILLVVGLLVGRVCYEWGYRDGRRRDDGGRA